MSLKLLKFNIHSFLTTGIDTNTIFGAICWGIVKLYGESELEKFLEEFKESPPFLITSPLPLDGDGNVWFPRPPLEGSIMDTDERSVLIERYPIHKQFKKINYLDWETFKKILQGDLTTEKELFEELVKRTEQLLQSKRRKIPTDVKDLLREYRGLIPTAKSEVAVKTAIDRLTNTAKEGQLFNEIITALPQFAVIVKVKNNEWWVKAKKALSVVKLGGNKTVGLGRFNFEEVDEGAFLKELETFVENKTEKCITLAPTFYEGNIDIVGSYYEPQIYRSAVDKTYAYGDPDFITLPVWKKATLYLKTGAMLKLKRPSGVIGALKETLKWDRGSRTYRVYNYGYGFPLFVQRAGGNL